MQEHRRRTSNEELHRNPRPPQRVTGGTGSSTVLALLDNVQTLPASRRLVSDPAAPVTRPQLLLGQAPKPGLCIGSCHEATKAPSECYTGGAHSTPDDFVAAGEKL